MPSPSCSKRIKQRRSAAAKLGHEAGLKPLPSKSLGAPRGRGWYARLLGHGVFAPFLLYCLYYSHSNESNVCRSRKFGASGTPFVPKENPCFKPAEIILHRSRRVGHEEHEDLEQIARYILRSPFSTAKMHLEPGAGSVLYRTDERKSLWRLLIQLYYRVITR